MSAQLQSGTDFVKNGDVVVGKTPAAVAAFKGLQADLNYFAEKVGFEVVQVDGKLGPKTTSAIKAVYDAVVKTRQMLAHSMVPPTSPEKVAEVAPAARTWLDEIARKTLEVGDLRRYHQGAGKDWNTKESIAYGAGPVHEDFKALQQDLNKFAETVGFAKLDVDGFLGPKTAQAVTAIYNAVKAKSSAFEMMAFPLPETKEDVAEYAQFIRAWLASSASKKLLVEAVS